MAKWQHWLVIALSVIGFGIALYLVAAGFIPTQLAGGSPGGLYLPMV